MRFHFSGAVVLVVAAVSPSRVRAQVTPLSRAQAVAEAIDHGGRLGVARADTAVANAQLIAARALLNPDLNASYSKSFPNYHVTADVPIDFPFVRRLRIQSARTGLEAAQLTYALARATIQLDADTTYTRALAAREHLALSRRNAIDADSLLRMAILRRDAGDAADLDVELARVFAGQQENLAAADSLTLVSALIDLQVVLGILSDRVAVAPTDSLTFPPPSVPAAATRPLAVAAASLSLESATFAARLQHRSILPTPTISAGFEEGDPGQHGILPTFGIGIGLPLLDRNRGAIAQAEAERVRASAELSLTELETTTELARATREYTNALARADRDRQLVADADRVAAMSLTAYREGASALPNVLEAQRTARDVLGQYIDDLAAAWVAAAELRVFSLTSTTGASR